MFVKNMGVMGAKINQEDLRFLMGLMNAGKVRSIIDRRYPLGETAAALRYLEEGRARGKVVITV
jgi:NADPH:quinone reductase-like Zn-dependent oxidoreductase